MALEPLGKLKSLYQPLMVFYLTWNLKNFINAVKLYANSFLRNLIVIRFSKMKGSPKHIIWNVINTSNSQVSTTNMASDYPLLFSNSFNSFIIEIVDVHNLPRSNWQMCWFTNSMFNRQELPYLVRSHATRLSLQPFSDAIIYNSKIIRNDFYSTTTDLNGLTW